jgi:chemotaxis signal transduction protein
LKYAIFTLADKQKYAVNINNVIEVMKCSSLSVIPGTDDSVAGMTNIRNEPILVKSPHLIIQHLDMDLSLNQEHWMVVTLNGNKMIMIVSSVNSISDIEEDDWDCSFDSSSISGIVNYHNNIIQRISLDSFIN